MFLWPLPGLYWVYSDYYDQRDYGMHVSIDIAPHPAPVPGPWPCLHPSTVAIAAGRITFVGWAGNAGRQVWLDIPSGYRAHYSHLSAFNVVAGQEVQAGDVIGLVGGSMYGQDHYTGDHLHFTLLTSERPATGPSVWIWFAQMWAVDPMLYLDISQEEDSNLPDPIFKTPSGLRAQVGVAGKHPIGDNEHEAALIAGGAKVVTISERLWKLLKVAK